MSLMSEYEWDDTAYWDWVVSTHGGEPEMVCTYQRENGKAPHCTHQCSGCVWCEERWPDDDE